MENIYKEKDLTVIEPHKLPKRVPSIYKSLKYLNFNFDHATLLQQQLQLTYEILSDYLFV